MSDSERMSVEEARSVMRQHVGERIEEGLLHNANIFGEDDWVDAIAEIAVQETATVEAAIRAERDAQVAALVEAAEGAMVDFGWDHPKLTRLDAALEPFLEK